MQPIDGLHRNLHQRFGLLVVLLLLLASAAVILMGALVLVGSHAAADDAMYMAPLRWAALHG